MDISSYISTGISFLGLLGGFLSWTMSLKIKNDILVNNEKYEKRFSEQDDKHHREMIAQRDKFSDRLERLDRDLLELKSNLADRILSIVNGKYVRTDLYQQSLAGIQERFVSFKQLIEVSMDKIEHGLAQQLVDLKERIFDGNQPVK